jgi:hypothetical protein
MIFWKGELNSLWKPFNVVGFVFQMYPLEIVEEQHRVFAIRKNVAAE